MISNQAAFDLFLATAAADQKNVCAALESMGHSHHKAERISRRLSWMEDASRYRQSAIGKLLRAEYRQDTGHDPESIEDFKQWCLEHWKLILGLKIVGAVIFFFCI